MWRVAMGTFLPLRLKIKYAFYASATDWRRFENDPQHDPARGSWAVLSRKATGFVFKVGYFSSADNKVYSYCQQNSHNNRKHNFIRRFGLCVGHHQEYMAYA